MYKKRPGFAVPSVLVGVSRSFHADICYNFHYVADYKALSFTSNRVVMMKDCVLTLYKVVVDVRSIAVKLTFQWPHNAQSSK